MSKIQYFRQAGEDLFSTINNMFDLANKFGSAYFTHFNEKYIEVKPNTDIEEVWNDIDKTYFASASPVELGLIKKQRFLERILYLHKMSFKNSGEEKLKTYMDNRNPNESAPILAKRWAQVMEWRFMKEQRFDPLFCLKIVAYLYSVQKKEYYRAIEILKETWLYSDICQFPEYVY